MRQIDLTDLTARLVGVVVLFLGAVGAAPAAAPGATQAQVFASPEDAVVALKDAVTTTNRPAFTVLFGPDAVSLFNPDSVQGAQELNDFAAALIATNRLVRESEGRMVLEVGHDNWPLPIPLVKVANGWQFDTLSGLQELLNRRIGRNELDVLKVMRGYVQAQREYASRDRDGDEVLEYAQRISSSPGRTDGLYWSPEINGEISPLGPFFARAQAFGYFRGVPDPDAEPQPFHGYLFKILTRQGKHAPGGKYNYIINGNMIGGFALVAWPAAYGDTGIMTFLVSHQGRVYQKDLGKSTGKVASRMKEYDPGDGWQVSPD